MRKSAPLWVIGVLMVTLWGVAGAAQPGPSGRQLGQNMGGEFCRADGDLTEAKPVDIFCADTTQSVGRLQVTALGTSLPADPVARRAAIFARAKNIASGFLVSEQISCDSGQLLNGAGGSVLFLCTMQSSSWPRIVMFSGVDRTLYQAEGLPGMLPVLAAAISAASGHDAEPTELAAGQSLLAAKLPAIVFKLGTTDFARYTQAIELARASSSGNDFASAETTLRSALEIDTQLFGPDSVPVGLAVMELALQVSNQGRFDEAASLFQRASPIIQASLSADARARLNSYLALDAANQRQFAKALAFARQATAERRAEVESANSTGGSITGFSGLPAISSGELAHSLRIEAEMALRLDDLAGAQAAAEEALWIISLEPGLALWWRADAVALMGEVNERQGRAAAAERNFLEGIDLRQKLFGDSAPVVLSQLRIGKFYTDQERYPEALNHFRTALAILEKNPVARSRVVPDQIIPFIAAATSIPAGPQQRAMLDAEIFRATQLANSDVADQAIARASVRLAAANSTLAESVRNAQEAQRVRERLRIDIAAEFAKPDDERNPAREAQLAQSLAQSSARANELAMRVQQIFPDYVRLTNPGPAEISDVQAQLGSGEAFLSFVVGFRGSYGLLVTANGLTAKRLDVASESLAEDIAVLRRAFTPQLGKLPEFSLRNAYTLYTQLLGPFATDLKGVDHLIVAPGPVLSNLPFSLLVRASPSDTGSYGDAPWLIRDMAVSQVPSPRAFLSLRQAEKTRVAAPRPFLGLGNPTLTGAAEEQGGASALDTLALSCRDASPMAPGLLRALPPLPDTAEEVDKVAQALGGDSSSILLGANADEATLRSKPLDQYRVLYFATHGLLPGELHCQAEPGLVLSPPVVAASSTDMDGLLEASEVAAMRLNADLVVLSACNTAAAGHGRFGGDALEGLADAFFNAGARAVLASHWEIPSAATTMLMTDVFRRYGQDRMRGLAEALRQSQLDLTREPATAHPFNWAAFTLIGVGDADRVSQQANGGLP
jgi:CHAT domain-containing protein